MLCIRCIVKVWY